MQDQLPAAPAGLDELSDEQLQEAAGGMNPYLVASMVGLGAIGVAAGGLAAGGVFKK